MRREKKTTRRRTAWKRLAALGILVVLAVSSGLWNISPERALGQLARQHGLAEAQIAGEVTWFGGTPGSRHYVLQSREYLMLAQAEFKIFSGGWKAHLLCDLSTGTPAPAVFRTMTVKDILQSELLNKSRSRDWPSPDRYMGVLVQVCDPAAAAVELEKTGQSSGAVVRVRVPQEQWQQGPFGPWFFYMFEQPDREFANVRLRVLDGEGAPILWTDDEYGTAEWYSFHWP